jgi:hypothetical protein
MAGSLGSGIDEAPGATAQCADGCYTFSENPTDDDTCHGRGGVKQYL